MALLSTDPAQKSLQQRLTTAPLRCSTDYKDFTQHGFRRWTSYDDTSSWTCA